MRGLYVYAFIPEDHTADMKASQGLSINMETLTPEVILHVARVVRVDDERLDLELMSDNGAAGASFGGPIAAEDEDFEGPVMEEFSWDEIFKGDFRLVASH